MIVRNLLSVNVIILLKIFSHSDKDRIHDGIKDCSRIDFNSLIVIHLVNAIDYRAYPFISMELRNYTDYFTNCQCKDISI